MQDDAWEMDSPAASLSASAGPMDGSPEILQDLVPDLNLETLQRAARCIAWMTFTCRPQNSFAVEVYMGGAFLTKRLVDGMVRAIQAVRADAMRGEALPVCGSRSSASQEPPVLLSFDGRSEAIDGFLSEQPATQRIQDILLAAHGLEVHRLSGQPLPLAGRLHRHLQGSLPKMIAVHGSAYPSELCPRGCGRSMEGSFDVLDCFRCPRPRKNQSTLREICEELADRTLELAVIDTGGPAIEEWHVLETHCRPRSVFLMNINLPLHEGWIADRLLGAGMPWREVLSGTLRWGWSYPHMLGFVEEARWMYLVDFSRW
ncbi:unnamed protein product [Symbiodinium necroappetens]|uniref:Uncharacterized protein n=1 Tax=Symbiodinium necroappetens TaxID=1628268 RepID=A0A812N0K5_9DINO|nr:unnamed protein product [Symbiodinium necroappetens]